MINKTKKNRFENFNKDNVVDNFLVDKRTIFLYEAIDEASIKSTVKDILTLDSLNSNPIILFINSDGGYVADGIALMDVMLLVRSPIITIVNGHACSMAAFIAMIGKERYMTPNSQIMFHDISGGSSDYLEKTKYSIENTLKIRDRMEELVKKYTKFTTKDIEVARYGELWLFAEEALKKGVVDKILDKSITVKSKK